MEGVAIQALMELALPQLGDLGDRSVPGRKPWMVSTDSPASPDPACTTDLARSPSPCFNLDSLSSDDNGDISVTVLCASEDDHTPVCSNQVLSDVDLPAAPRDRRQSYSLKNCLQWSGFSDGRCPWDSRWMAQMGSSNTLLVFRI